MATCLHSAHAWCNTVLLQQSTHCFYAPTRPYMFDQFCKATCWCMIPASVDAATQQLRLQSSLREGQPVYPPHLYKRSILLEAPACHGMVACRAEGSWSQPKPTG
jgi:hypothetical protein